MVRKRVSIRRDTSYNDDRIKSFNQVVDKLKGGWGRASETIQTIRSVPTIFPQVNVGTRVLGWPIQRICLVHGPSNHGKTLFVLGLGLSFLKAGHFYAFIDAERTTPKPWVKTLMGQYMNHPGFLTHDSESYENTVDEVRRLVTTVAEAREKGTIEPDVSVLVALDSIRKLVPRRLLKMIMKGADKEKGNIDGMSGRAGQYKAALNSAWMDELTNLMYSTNSGIIFIGREAENTDIINLHSPKWKLTGGKGLFYDSSLVIRVTRQGWVKDKSTVIGEKHCASIYKTKVGGKDDKVTNCFFHTSNGHLIKEGFDRARDIIDLGKKCGLIKMKGGWLHSESSGETWQGENAAVKSLTSDVDTLNMLESEVMDMCQPGLLDIENLEDE